MIRINKEDISDLDILEENFDKLIDIILNNPKYYPGSFHENTNLSELINCVDQVLFKENNSSMQIIIEKKPNNSLDLTIDLIK